MLGLFTILDILAACLAIWILHRYLTWRESQQRLPPGPKGYPVIGNLFDMPRSHEWDTYASWADRWGEIVSVSVLGKRIVILSSIDVATALLDSRSAIYSDRPRLALTADHDQKTIPMAPYGDRMRLIRRMFAKAIGARALPDSVGPLISRSVQDLMARLLKSPEHLMEHVHLMTAENAMLISHGYDVKGWDDPYLKKSRATLKAFAELAGPTSFLIDLFPPMRHIPAWFPFAKFKRTAKQFLREVEEAANGPLEFAKREMAAGTALPSFVSRNLTEGDVSPDHEEAVKFGANALYNGGSDTTAAALSTFFLAVLLNPSAQQRAQAELDAVVGHDRLPTLGDRDNLPYVRALCSEILRWNPTAPLGLPHRLIQDDAYNKYFLPAGSVFFVNIRKLLRDPRRYADPEAFRPERFLGEPEFAPEKIVFGFGRRMCPGIVLAESTLFMTVATTLALFDITPVVENGKVVQPADTRPCSGAIAHPPSFRCNIKPRTAKTGALIQSAVDSR